MQVTGQFDNYDKFGIGLFGHFAISKIFYAKLGYHGSQIITSARENNAIDFLPFIS